MRSTFIFYPWYSVSRVSPQSHNPLVQGLIVGPTPNPWFFLLIMTLFSKKLLPVLYFPATEITPTFSLIYLRNYLASSDTLNCSIKNKIENEKDLLVA